MHKPLTEMMFEYRATDIEDLTHDTPWPGKLFILNMCAPETRTVGDAFGIYVEVHGPMPCTVKLDQSDYRIFMCYRYEKIARPLCL